MKAFLLLAVAAQPTNARPDLWRGCEITSATICAPAGCRETRPTVKLYMADYIDSKSKRDSYYYRCRISGGCDMHDDVAVTLDHGDRVWTVSTPSIIATISLSDQVTDIATRNGLVLIQRGTCKLEPPPLVITPTAPRPRP